MTGRISFTLLNGDDIAKINVAMNNLIRIVWELKTCGEHNELKPFEAIKDLNLSDIELSFNALKLIVNSEFKNKVDLLFGNKKVMRVMVIFNLEIFAVGMH